MWHRIYRAGLLTVLALALTAPSAQALPRASSDRPVLTGTMARAKIARDNPSAEIEWCTRKAPRWIRCRAYLSATIENEAGEVGQTRPLPYTADVGLRGVYWESDGFF